MTAALAALLLAGCGSTGAHPAVSPSPSPSSSPVGGQISEADGGKTFSIHLGDSVEVALHERPGMTPWQDVTSTNTAVLQPQVDTRAAAVRGVTLAKFKAAGAGSAAITATAVVACSPGAACPALAQVWRVTIVVSS